MTPPRIAAVDTPRVLAVDTTRILAVDPSLTRTGLCLPDGTTHGIATNPGDYASPMARLNYIAECLFVWIAAAPREVDLVVIEGAMMTARVGPETMFLHGIIRHKLWTHKYPLVDIAGASRQKYACGAGKERGKDEVLAAAIRAGSDCKNNDEADAYWLWRIASDAYGPADADLPQYRREVLARYSPWPTINGHTPRWPMPAKQKKAKAAA